MKKKDLNDWTRKDFEKLRQRDWGEDIGLFDSFIILPLRSVHSSGYRCLDFVAVKSGQPICRLSGCSDVVHIDGIAGFGANWVEKYGRCPDAIPPVGWSIDCLKTSGLLRLFTGSTYLTCGSALSSFEVFAGEKRAAKAAKVVVTK